MEGFNLSTALAFFWNSLTSFLTNNFETIVAAFVLLLAYRLLRVGLEKCLSSGDQIDWRRYIAFVAPGVGFSLIGVVFIMGRDPMSLLLYLMTLTVIVGFGFAFLGYRLFREGVFGNSDIEAVWNEKKMLLKRAAPGTLFALFGLAMINITLLKGPEILSEHFKKQQEYLKEQRAANEQIVNLLDARVKDALALLEQYLKSK